MNLESRNELKPCPFCGSNAGVANHGYFGSVRCTNDLCGANIYTGTRVESVLRWNHRADIKCVHQLAKEWVEDTTYDPHC